MTVSLASLLLRGLSGDSGVPDDATSTRIIDATVVEIASGGVQRLTVEQVARRAGVNRATVYRKFGDLDGVLAAMTMREGAQMAATILAAVEGIDDVDRQLVEGFAAAIRVAREHPVIARTATHEPGSLVEAGLADGAALLELGSGVAEGLIRTAQGRGQATHLDAGQAGQTLARLFAACVLLSAAGGLDLSTDDSARDYARRTLVPMIFGPPESSLDSC
jgi:AcrR family transcriptional regulator